jgi:hypothetical protein
MNIHSYDEQWFRHVIAAPSRETAHSFVVSTIRKGVDGIVPLVEILTPDVLTRRAADACVKPTEIDTIPLFWMDVEHRFPRQVDYENLSLLGPEQRADLAAVSSMHREWTDADADPQVYAAIVALESSPRPEQVRAMSAAFGEGPLPPWMRSIAPALFALDVGYDYHNAGLYVDPFARCANAVVLRDRVRQLAEWADDRGDTALAFGAATIAEWMPSPNQETVRQSVRDCLSALGWL